MKVASEIMQFSKKFHNTEKNYITQEINEVYSVCALNKVMMQSTLTSRLPRPLSTVTQPSTGEHGCKMCTPFELNQLPWFVIESHVGFHACRICVVRTEIC